MALVLRIGQTNQGIKEVMNTVRNMELVLLPGLMDLNTSVNLLTITSMAEGSIIGLIIDDMKVNGRTTRCMGKEHSLGLMVENTLENIVKTRKKVMVSSSGQTVDATEASGLMENNKVKDLS